MLKVISHIEIFMFIILMPLLHCLTFEEVKLGPYFEKEEIYVQTHTVYFYRLKKKYGCAVSNLIYIDGEKVNFLHNESYFSFSSDKSYIVVEVTDKSGEIQRQKYKIHLKDNVLYIKATIQFMEGGLSLEKIPRDIAIVEIKRCRKVLVESQFNIINYGYCF